MSGQEASVLIAVIGAVVALIIFGWSQYRRRAISTASHGTVARYESLSFPGGSHKTHHQVPYMQQEMSYREYPNGGSVFTWWGKGPVDDVSDGLRNACMTAFAIAASRQESFLNPSSTTHQAVGYRSDREVGSAPSWPSALPSAANSGYPLSSTASSGYRSRTRQTARSRRARNVARGYVVRDSSSSRQQPTTPW